MARRKPNQPFTATCEAEGCYTTFTTTISTRKYCCYLCAKRAENLRAAQRKKEARNEKSA